MSTSKREREYARRRHEKWLARQAEAAAARRRRQRILVGAILGLAVLVAAVVLVLNLTGDDPAPPVAEPTPTASPLEPSQSPEPERPVPDPSVAEARTWTATVPTSVGELVLELDGEAAPQAVASFVSLAQEGFFDDTSCHRLTTTEAHGIAVLQCGDPTGTSSGGPGYRFGPIENAPADDVYPAGTLAMARVQDDGASMGSQFFIVYEDSTIQSDEAGGYTVFGRVISGLDVVTDVAEAGTTEGTQTPVTEVTIEGVELQ